MTPGTTLSSTSQWHSAPQCCLGGRSSTASAWAHSSRARVPPSGGPPTTFSSAPPPHRASSTSAWATPTPTTSAGSAPRTWTPPAPSTPCPPGPPAPTLPRRRPPRWRLPPWFSAKWTPGTPGCFWPQQRRSCSLLSSIEALIVTLFALQSVLFIAPILDTRFAFLFFSSNYYN